MQVAKRAHQRKRDADSGQTSIVGLNCFAHTDRSASPMEIFAPNPESSRRVLEKLAAVKETRNTAAVELSIEKLRSAAAKDDENLLPYLIDCAHSYTTVGEMVQCLKGLWGEFQEPLRL